MKPPEVPSRIRLIFVTLLMVRATATTVLEIADVELMRRRTSPSGMGVSQIAAEPEWINPPTRASLLTIREAAVTAPVKTGLLFNCAKAPAGSPPRVIALTFVKPVPFPANTFAGLVKVRALPYTPERTALGMIPAPSWPASNPVNPAPLPTKILHG